MNTGKIMLRIDHFLSHIRGPRSEKGILFVTHHALSKHRDEHPVYSPFSYGKG